jgi:hypothetical protein
MRNIWETLEIVIEMLRISLWVVYGCDGDGSDEVMVRVVLR